MLLLLRSPSLSPCVEAAVSVPFFLLSLSFLFLFFLFGFENEVLYRVTG